MEAVLNLSHFRTVVVAGPQRSGTTITARIIAHDSHMLYVDEDDYGTKDKLAWRRFVDCGENMVVHSPAMSRFVHEVAAPDVCVVWVKRSIGEILASQRRIGWDDSDERAKYDAQDDPRPVAVIQERFWAERQRDQIQHVREVSYHSLYMHTLFVPAVKRQGWGKRQWRGK